MDPEEDVQGVKTRGARAGGTVDSEGVDVEASAPDERPNASDVELAAAEGLGSTAWRSDGVGGGCNIDPDALDVDVDSIG